MKGLEKAKKYLLEIGLDDAHLPELFNDDDKSYYTIPELMKDFAKQAVAQALEKAAEKAKIIPVKCCDCDCDEMEIMDCRDMSWELDKDSILELKNNYQ